MTDRDTPPTDPMAQARAIQAALRRVGVGPGAKQPELVNVSSVQVSGISYANIGQPGLDFLEAWADAGARATVPSFMNPAGMDMTGWRELGISEAFAEKQARVVEALKRIGVEPSLTCTPYELAFKPTLGQHLAWAESSAVSCANSLFGARTNREGGPSALAAAITGQTVRNGCHLDRNRRPTHVVEVHSPLRSPADFGALGLRVGREIESGVPYFLLHGLDAPIPLRHECAKALAAAMAASGSVALFHIDGWTPEARTMTTRIETLPRLEIDDLANAGAAWRGQPGPVDVVAVGCPHASAGEVRRVANMLDDRPLRARLWVMTSRAVAEQLADSGEQAALQKAGGTLVCDMCIVVAPLDELNVRRVVTNSAKTAYYLRSKGISAGLGSLDECVEAAVTGEWTHGGEATAARSVPGAVSLPNVDLGLSGISVVPGEAEGELLVSQEPISFFGNVDPETGAVTEPGHALEGVSVAGKVLAFPRAKGSTVGSYVIYALQQNGKAPLAILNQEMEAIVAAGAVIAGIPAADHIDTTRLTTGRRARVKDGEVTLG